MKVRVYYEDTDSLGMVYHANYLKFIERARSEIFFAAGEKPDGGGKGGSYFVVRSMKLRFIKSAKLGDLLDVKSKILEFRFASFRILQEIFLEDMLIFSAEVELAHLVDQKPAVIPNELKRRLLAGLTHNDFYERGDVYLYLDDYANAIDNYTKAIEVDPKCADAYFHRGLTYTYLKDYSSAVKDYTKWIEISPTNANAYNSRAMAYIKQENYKLAEMDAKKANELGDRTVLEYMEKKGLLHN